MNNLSNREKILIFCVVAALIILVFGLLIIRPLINKNKEADATLKAREATDRYYIALMQSNEELEAQITKTENSIKEIEASLLKEVRTYSIVNYIEQVFEKKESPYVAEINSQNIACDEITLPNGQIADVTLQLKRIEISYAGTDGYTINEWNGQPSWVDENGNYKYEEIKNAIMLMGDMTETQRLEIVGYNEFMAGLQQIAAEHPSCVKVHSCTVEDSGIGFLYLKAEIDCFSAELGQHRLLDNNDPSQQKIDWQGNSNVSCAGGLIGIPLYNGNRDNAFFGYAIAVSELKNFTNRPYASYFSSAILSEIAKNNISLWDLEADQFGKSLTEPYADAVDEAAGTSVAAPADGEGEAAEEPAA